ncbi:MAG: prepilin-type N-terminal cleavage/methylation domain-containing protein [Magnetococcales bacterium]|nr:prepilin-type N-terminal cleavage/methylation domain-containing protein [Magnetococcales bacterium]
MNSVPNRLCEAGFSLVEVLIALLILIFGVTTTAEFSKNIGQANLFSRQHSDGVRLARTRLEQLRHYRDRSEYDAIQNGSSSFSAPSASYTVSWSVTANTTPLYKLVRVQSAWVDHSGSARTVALSSIIAWAGPGQ